MNTIPKGAIQRSGITKEGKMVNYNCDCGCGWFMSRKKWRDNKVVSYIYTCIECKKVIVE